MIPDVQVKPRGNEIKLDVGPEIVLEVRQALVEWQKEKNKGRLDEVNAVMPLRKREQILKYLVMFAVLIVTGIFTYVGILNSQITVAVLFGLLGFVGAAKIPELFNKDEKQN